MQMKTCDFSYVRLLVESTMFMLMPTKMVEMEWIRRIVILFRSSWMKNIGMEIKMDKSEKIRKLWKPSQIELFWHGTFSGLGRGVQK